LFSCPANPPEKPKKRAQQRPGGPQSAFGGQGRRLEKPLSRAALQKYAFP